MSTSWSSLSLKSHFEYLPSNPEGIKPILVLIHGLGLEMTTWDLVWDQFREAYGVLRYNVPGHGGREYSAMPPLEALTDDLHALLLHLNINQIHIVGHGMGANIGLHFSTRYPNMVLTLTAISSHLYFSRSISDEMQQYRRELVNDETLQRLSLVMIPKIHMNPQGQTGQMLSLAYGKISPSTYFSLLNRNSIGHYNAAIRENANTELPILTIAGEHDLICPPYIYGVSTSIFTNSRFVILPDASNVVQLDAPEMVTKLALEFIHLHEQSVSTAPRHSTLHTLNLLDLLDKPNRADELKIGLLNHFHVAINDVPVLGGWNKRKARQIFVYLVLNNGVTRDQLCDEFWPNINLQQARSNLRVTLHHLKKLLGSDQNFLKVERDSIRLEGIVLCDVIDLMYELQGIAAESNHEKKATMIEKIISEITPNSFAMFYETWILPIRSKVELHVTTAASWLGEYYFSRGQYTFAMSAWEYALQFDDYGLSIYDRILEAAGHLQSPGEMGVWEKRRNEKLIELGQ